MFSCSIGAVITIPTDNDLYKTRIQNLVSDIQSLDIIIKCAPDTALCLILFSYFHEIKLWQASCFFDVFLVAEYMCCFGVKSIVSRVLGHVKFPLLALEKLPSKLKWLLNLFIYIVSH